MPSSFLAGSTLGRRTLLRALGASGLASLLPSCGYFPPESGAAYAPWHFPDQEARPAWRMAQAGILAANPHNSQPWRFEITDDRVRLWADLERNLGSIDSLRREMHVGLGCALENMRLSAEHDGRPCEIALLPDAAESGLVAELSLGAGEPVSDPLFDAIPQRHTNRGRYADVDPPRELEPSLRALLSEAENEVALIWLATRAERAEMRDATIAATRAVIDDEAMSRDSYAWYRHSEDDIHQHRDGITLDATGRGALTRSLGKIAKKPSRATTDDYWLDATKHDQATASAYVVLGSSADDERRAQLRIGMVFQRMHLWATAHGLALQPLNQLLECRDREESAQLTPRFGALLDDLVGGATRGQMIFRLGYAWDDAFESPRRPLSWVKV